MAELTLKDESVIDIGQAVGERVQSIAQTGTSTAMVPAGGAIAPAVVAEPMNPFDSVMGVLTDIRDGIFSLVDKFTEGVSLQQEQINQQEMSADLSQAASGEDTTQPEETDDRSFLQKAKDKTKDLLGKGGFMGLLIKGGLLAGLLLLAKGLQKYGDKIAKAVAPIIDGIKAFFSAFSDDIGPLFDKAVGMVKDAISGLLLIFKGLFTGDASTFISGVKKIIVDFPIKLVSYIGDSFFSLLENALAAFGIESQMVTDIKLFFRQLPEKISELFAKVGEFFTVTIPEKVTEIKTSITNFFNDKIVTPAKQLFTDIGNFFTQTIPEKFTEISGKVTSFFTDIVSSITGFFTDGFNFVTQTIPEKLGEITTSIATKFTEIKDQIIDFAMAPFRKIKELMQNLLVGILESVEGLPFIGDKAKALKEKILGTGASAGAETLDTAGTGDASIAEAVAMPEPKIMTNEIGDVVNPDTGKKVKFGRNDEDAAAEYAAELSKMGQGKFEPYFETKGLNHYAIRKTGEAITSAGNTTIGGSTGAEINNAGADFVNATGAGSGGGVYMGGNSSNVSNVNNNSYTNIPEDTGSDDKNYMKNLYD